MKNTNNPRYAVMHVVYDPPESTGRAVFCDLNLLDPAVAEQSRLLDLCNDYAAGVIDEVIVPWDFDEIIEAITIYDSLAKGLGTGWIIPILLSMEPPS